MADEEKPERNTALEAFTYFISQYSPATKTTALLFCTTTDISNAIADHTGIRLESTEVFKLMTDIGYTYDTLESLEFVWMMKRES